MTRYLTVEQVEELHSLVLTQSGGRTGTRDAGALASAVAQPRATFAGDDLYASLADKAAALALALVQNHPFVDGNKRVGHAAMEVFLMLNGYELAASIEVQENLFLALASGQVTREELAEQISVHMIAFPSDD